MRETFCLGYGSCWELKKFMIPKEEKKQYTKYHKLKTENKIKLSLSAWFIIAEDNVSCGCYSYNSCCVAMLPFR